MFSYGVTARHLRLCQAQLLGVWICVDFMCILLVVNTMLCRPTCAKAYIEAKVLCCYVFLLLPLR